MIEFNKPYFTGKETEYIEESVRSGKISGDGIFTKRCNDFFYKKLRSCYYILIPAMITFFINSFSFPFSF